MSFKRVWAAVLALVLSMAICLPSVLAFGEPSATPSKTEAPESGMVRGSSRDDEEATGSPKPYATPKAKETDEEEEEAEETEAPAPTATADPRVNEDGTPNMAEQEAAILVNTLNGEVMFEQNSTEQIYPASTTKIMTALLTLEAVDRGEINLNSSFLIMPEMLEDLEPDGSSMLLKEGEAMSVRYLLEGLLVESGNDAAQALAIIVCGDVPTFVERMNNKAAELGMDGTHFVNPHGLHDDDHYTTAKDLATLTVEAMKNKTFREIVAMTQAIIPPTEKVGTRTFINTNGLLSTLKYTGYYYSYAIGVKTGHTSQAGYCLVSAAKKGNLEVVGVVMNCKSEDDRHYDSRNMLAYAIDNYKAVTAVSSGDMVGEIKVKFGSGANHTTLSTVEDIVVTIPEDANAEDLVLEPQLADYVAAPVAQGEVIGTVNVVLNGKVVGSGDLVADSTVKRHPLGFLMQFFSFIWGFAAVKVIIIALLAAIVILAIYMYVNIRRNIKESQRQRRKTGRRRTK